MSTARLPFSTTSFGDAASLYLLSNEQGMVVGVTDFGACLVSAHVLDVNGNHLDVALGHAGVIGYERNGEALGATIGRNANRIAGASFELDGVRHQLEANEGPNNLHSGPHPWFERMWDLTNLSDDSVTLGLLSRAGDQGFPGEVSAHVTYRISDDNQLTVFFSALSAQPTIINMANHTYWNLNGHASGTVADHVLHVQADRYIPVDQQLIPTGELAPVDNTPFDLRAGRLLGDCFEGLPGGFDHNFCLPTDGTLKHAARLVGGRSGIALDVSTDACGIQVYTAGMLDLPAGKDGARYGAFTGVALETQYWPDAIHHPDWPQPVHGPDRPFVSTTIYAFSLA